MCRLTFRLTIAQVHANGRIDDMQIFRIDVCCAAIQLASLGATMAQDTPPSEKPFVVTLTNYAYTPSTIILKANTPVTLHLVNNASKSHNFSAPEFFAEVTIAVIDRSKVADGVIELDDGETVDVTVTPNRVGTYKLNCTHFIHAVLGMSGQIAVQ